MPGTWYQMGLHCTTVSRACPFDVSGFTFAGLPGVVIGHNAHIAWGFTNVDPDVEDL
jgi:penicillin G amidase